LLRDTGLAGCIEAASVLPQKFVVSRDGFLGSAGH
jgi:hypothetical protein